MPFTNLEQRMAQTYLDMLPAFVPDESAPVSVPEQERFYALMQSLYQLAFDEPLLFVPALHEDGAYTRMKMKSVQGKQLQADMDKFTKAVDALLQNMFLMGQGADVKLKKEQQAVLSRLGIDNPANLPAAWVWMSTRPDAHLTDFSFCLFKKGYSYASDIYARLLGEAFCKLENWMAAKGYKRFDIYGRDAHSGKLTLTWANPAWGKEPPIRGSFLYKVRHTGIAAVYDTAMQRPAVFGICIPGNLQPFLKAFDTMDEKLQAFVFERTRKCTGCRYCVQTDKTGKRPLAMVPISFEGKTYPKCSYFPGINYGWAKIDDAIFDQVTDMLTFMDKFAPEKTGVKK